jgi:Ca2+-binding EF-hand superfamily protein
MQKPSSTTSLAATVKSKHSNTASGSETNDHEPKKMSSKYTHSDVMKIKSVFERIDVDHSGSISIKELTNSFEGTLSASASAMFAILDVDGSGTLEFNEILRAVFPLATEAEFVQMMSWVCS